MFTSLAALMSFAAFGDRQGALTYLHTQKCIEYFHKDREAHHLGDIRQYSGQPMTAHNMITGRRTNARELERIGRECGTRFIVLHGSLIGQRFNQDFLPWDDDLDVSVLPEDVRNLKNWTRRQPKGCTASPQSQKKFVEWYTVAENVCVYIDNNPRYHIEMRLVHMPTGVYTDITFLYKRGPKFVMKANINHLWGGHVFPRTQLLPLRPCTLGPARLWCPAKPDQILATEYGSWWRSRTKTMNGHFFDSELNCWTK